MTVQLRNADLIRLLGADFQHRSEPNFAWRGACSAHQYLPGLRGFWPTSAFTDTGDATDQSGQGRTLTYMGATLYNYASTMGLLPYVDFTPGTFDYLTRGWEAALNISGGETFVPAASRGLTIGCWCTTDTIAAGIRALIGKYQLGGAAATRQYLLLRNTAALSFVVQDSALGAATTANHTTALDTTSWFHVVGRFTASTATAVLFVNGVAGAGSVAAAGTLNTGATNFSAGVSGAAVAGTYWDGKMSLAFLCATALPTVTIWSLYQQTKAMFGR